MSRMFRFPKSTELRITSGLNHGKPVLEITIGSRRVSMNPVEARNVGAMLNDMATTIEVEAAVVRYLYGETPTADEQALILAKIEESRKLAATGEPVPRVN